jgi:hypothetical protein
MRASPAGADADERSLRPSQLDRHVIRALLLLDLDLEDDELGGRQRGGTLAGAHGQLAGEDTLGEL